MKPRDPASWPSLAALFAAALVAVHRWAGDSPALWLDTLNDQHEVRKCVVRGSCSLIGQAASIDGIFHANGWLAARALLFDLGLDLERVHLLFQVLDALGVALVAYAGYRLGGRVLGAVAAFVLVYYLGTLGPTPDALYNSTPLPFLGATLLVACLAAVERPGLLPSVVTALLAAVMTNFHSACAVTGATVVWVALLPPGRRLLRAAVTAAVFAAASFAIAPLGWILDARFFLHGAAGAGHAAPHPLVALSAIVGVMRADPIAWLSVIGVTAWLIAAIARWATLRRALDVSTAVAAPLLVAYLIALRHGVPDAGGKYLAHIKPAAALGAAVLVVVVAREVLASFVPPSAASATLRRAGAWAVRLSPWAAALAVVGVARSSAAHEMRPAPHLTMSDVDAIAHVLRDEHGWSRARVRRRVMSLEQGTLLMGLLDEARGGFPGGDAGDDGTTALVLALAPGELPNPVPPSWTVARRTASTAAVIVFSPSLLDWSHSELCVPMGDSQRCVHEGERREGDESLSPGTMVLHVPLRASAPASRTRIFMPRDRDVCAGRVVAVPGPGSSVASDGRRATLVGGDAGTLDVAWDLPAPACPAHFVGASAPFFLEATDADAAVLEALFRRRER